MEAFTQWRRGVGALLRGWSWRPSPAAPNAALLFHDTFFQPGSGYNHGPYEASRALVREFGREDCQVVETHLGSPGMTLVMPRR